VGRGEEFVLDTTLRVSDTALEGDRDLKAGVNYTLCTHELYLPQRVQEQVQLSLPMPRRHIRTAGVQLHSFLTSAPDGRDQIHAPAALPSGIYPRTHSREGWMGARAGTDVLE